MIGIVDYGAGNLGSVKNALDVLGVKNEILSDLVKLEKTNALILPGDGAAPEAMRNLKKLKLDKFLKSQIDTGKPFLGICIGMQILLSFSEEGAVPCLDVINGNVKKFTDNSLKIPQIGWNRVKTQNSKLKTQNYNSKFKSLFENIPDKSYFYFVNSYYCDPEDQSLITGKTEYGVEFCSAIQKDNIYAVQFHPEKSGDVGMQLLKNFIKIAI